MNEMLELPEIVKQKLAVLPNKPGVYRYFDQKDYEKIQTLSADVTVVGYMTDDKGVAEMITPDNHIIPIKAQGWDHMRKKQ